MNLFRRWLYCSFGSCCSNTQTEGKYYSIINIATPDEVFEQQAPKLQRRKGSLFNLLFIITMTN